MPNSDELYEAMKNDLELFAVTICKNVVTDLPVPQFHSEIYKTIAKENRVVLSAPRGFSKSTLVSKIFPLWLSLYKKSTDICIISASESLAIEHLRYIKQEIESNMFLNHLFGDMRSEKWTEDMCILANGVTIRAKGAGAQIRGFRPSCLILDDVETDESVESEEQRRKLKDWLFRACLNTLLPEGKFLLIGTQLHPLCVLSELLNDESKDWVKKTYQAYVDGIQEEGHELWPGARSHKWLQGRKGEIGTSAFSAEYMNNPMLNENSPIQEKHIHYWDVLPEQLSVSIALDPAYSDDEKADYKVAVAVGIDGNNKRYLLDYVRTHNPSGEYIDQAINLYLKYKYKVMAFGVPNSGTEKEFYNKVVEKSMSRGIGLPIVPLSNTFVDSTGKAIRRKSKRITASLQPLFEQANYLIHKSHVEAREELLSIGFSRWDDLTDAMCYCEQILQPVYKGSWADEVDYDDDREPPTANYGFD